MIAGQTSQTVRELILLDDALSAIKKYDPALEVFAVEYAAALKSNEI